MNPHPHLTRSTARATTGRRWWNHPSVRVALAAAALLGAVVLPSPPGQAAATRPTSTRVRCTPSTITAGTTSTCTVTVTDQGRGRKSPPGGTIILGSTPADAIVIGEPCVLAPHGRRRSRCSVDVLFLSAGSRTVTAAYVPDDGIHSPGPPGSRRLRVGAPGSPVLFVPQSHTDGTIGDDIDIYGAGCRNDASAYEGEFVAMGADPLGMPIGEPGVGAFQPIEGATSAVGAFEWHVTIPPDNPTVQFQARFYCATSPVTSLSDSAIEWVSQPYVYTIHAATETVAPQAAVWVDPDEVPAGDSIAIHGPHAAALKERVDAALVDVASVSRLFFAFTGAPGDHEEVATWITRIHEGTPVTDLADALAATPEYLATFAGGSTSGFVQTAHQSVLGRTPEAAEAAFWEGLLDSGSATRVGVLTALADSGENALRSFDTSYVVATYQELTEVAPTEADLDRFTRQLRDVRFRVAEVEDVALSRAPASFWMDGVEAGSTPRA